MEALKGTQLRVLNMVRDFIATKGYSPSVREIAKAVHLGSTSVVVYNLNALEGKGYLQRDPFIARSIRLLH